MLGWRPRFLARDLGPKGALISALGRLQSSVVLANFTAMFGGGPPPEGTWAPHSREKGGLVARFAPVRCISVSCHCNHGDFIAVYCNLTAMYDDGLQCSMGPYKTSIRRPGPA